jgi:hypothetical protein
VPLSTCSRPAWRGAEGWLEFAMQSRVGLRSPRPREDGPERTDLPRPHARRSAVGWNYRDKGKVDGHDLKGEVPGLEAAVEADLGQVADYWRRR